ncbi:RagB/SusD family nutrient uptake outer membrane protein [Mariniflexile soesokkakense]|uniref:RagB/SusD family nutrient uptake outer membrane protein n=1 Tax=Mariniflexile soesokkakense TaxID=1343160 RepID=A0ABV0AFW3_9FLAO
MKNIYKFFISALLLGVMSCGEDFIDVQPQSYITEAIYFSNAQELNTALIGCYAGMRAPAKQEWKFTELRSDNAVMNQIATTSVDNLEFLSYDAFFMNTIDTNLSEFWFFNYVNIKNTNILLDKMNVNYRGGSIVYGGHSNDATVDDIKDVASQASFLRAYHYFNLVRLFGDVFLVTEPLSPVEATSLTRADKGLVYDLIIADLKNTIANGNTAKYSATAANGKANVWSAKALLAKVYLTLGRKSDALPLLTDVITNSGYGLESTYANVFSITNELNKEILFTIRYKSGVGNLGSPFTTSFAPATPTRNLSGTPIFVVSNQGDNAPGQELYDTFNMADARRNFILPSRDASTPQKLFYTKYWYSLSVRDDSEFDFPIIRYADVLLMYAEAAGSSDPKSLTYINQVRARAGLTGANALTTADIDTPAKFELAFANERRWEFIAENHRWFDILRYSTTTTTLNAVDIMENHFRIIHPLLYDFYDQNAEDVTLAILLERVDENSLLLPIPQIELDLDIEDDFNQNPGYN